MHCFIEDHISSCFQPQISFMRSILLQFIEVKVKVIPQQAEVAQVVRDFLDLRHYKGGRSSAIGTGRLYPRRNT